MASSPQPHPPFARGRVRQGTTALWGPPTPLPWCALRASTVASVQPCHSPVPLVSMAIPRGKSRPSAPGYVQRASIAQVQLTCMLVIFHADGGSGLPPAPSYCRPLRLCHSVFAPITMYMGTQLTRLQPRPCRCHLACSSLTGGTVDPQPCGSRAVFCPLGSVAPTQVQPGFYTAPMPGLSTTGGGDNMAQALECPAGNTCANGLLTPCPAGSFLAATGRASETECGECTAGFFCPAGSSAPTPCGASTNYCPAGAPLPSVAGQGKGLLYLTLGVAAVAVAVMLRVMLRCWYCCCPSVTKLTVVPCHCPMPNVAARNARVLHRRCARGQGGEDPLSSRDLLPWGRPCVSMPRRPLWRCSPAVQCSLQRPVCRRCALHQPVHFCHRRSLPCGCGVRGWPGNRVSPRDVQPQHWCIQREHRLPAMWSQHV
jgi:hypothetical protein